MSEYPGPKFSGGAVSRWTLAPAAMSLATVSALPSWAAKYSTKKLPARSPQTEGPASTSAPAAISCATMSWRGHPLSSTACCNGVLPSSLHFTSTLAPAASKRRTHAERSRTLPSHFSSSSSPPKSMRRFLEPVQATYSGVLLSSSKTSGSAPAWSWMRTSSTSSLRTAACSGPPPPGSKAPALPGTPS